MTGFWTLVGPSLVVFLVLGSVLCWASLVAVRVMKAQRGALLDLESRLEALLEAKTATLPPKRLEELDSFCNTLREEFSKLVALNEEWKSDSYRKVQRYATMINKKLRQTDGLPTQVHHADDVDSEEPELLDPAAVARADSHGRDLRPAAEAQEESIESVRAAFYNKARPF